MTKWPGLQDEKGAVLITGLILLLLLTLLGVTAMQGTTLQERMAGNLEQQDLAFQAAEAGLRAGENYVETNAPSETSCSANTSGLFAPAAAGNDPRWETVDWTSSTEFMSYTSGSLKASYIIEYMADGIESDGTTHYNIYRITSRAESPNSRGEVMLQSTYKYSYTP